MSAINLDEKFSLFNEHWTPKIVAESNGQLVKLAKGQGELVWHSHEHEDELFLVIKGQLTLRMKQGDVVLNPGEMYVVPKGVEHSPLATEETHFMMIEPASTAHTGTLKVDATVDIDEQDWI
ncbi:cupin domain-containing protein [Pleionea sp. CnH1-48]|uniref:cupin domain-containing protein n=1 Tax=Pleionea sp. CnH1-48 TaxID=2954494 RepID=UPI002097D37A|nr:cupin domain-containing protein [Pleionea sp. CnH1-48]MCO7223573.1 cupin domain-containing protein [Pleionea sp. CnH1-48]